MTFFRHSTGRITVLDRSGLPIPRRFSSCRTVLYIAVRSAGQAASQMASKIGAGQTVDEKVDGVIAEEDGACDVYPATDSV